MKVVRLVLEFVRPESTSSVVKVQQLVLWHLGIEMILLIYVHI